MKNFIFSLLLCCVASFAYAQNTYSDQQIQAKVDSILVEADLLYRFEHAAWVGTDHAFTVHPNLRNSATGYFVYKEDDKIILIFFNDNSECLYEHKFYLWQPEISSETDEIRNLSENEIYLMSIKSKIIQQIIDNNYEVGCPEGYNLNMILMPSGSDGYNFYIITGTSQNDIIPFGNDYIFETNADGKILKWRKFHSRLIPMPTKGPDGENVRGLIHSHLGTEPFITVTDICTFRLYAELYEIKTFSVYSPALKKYFTYNIDTNAVEIKN